MNSDLGIDIELRDKIVKLLGLILMETVTENDLMPADVIACAGMFHAKAVGAMADLLVMHGEERHSVIAAAQAMWDGDLDEAAR